MLSTAAYGIVLAAALAPFVIYIWFLLVYLGLDLINTILRTCNRYLSRNAE